MISSDGTICSFSRISHFSYNLNNFQRFIIFTFFNAGKRGGQDKLLPVWGSVWIGLVQPEYHILTVPTGSVQEAARCKANTGGYDGVQPMCWKVRIFKFSNTNLWFYIGMPEK